MIVTKYQAKQLQYKARANKSYKYSTRTVNGCKVKHREFPCCNLEYDEVKDSSGNYVLSNVAIGNEPFEGTYDELLERVSTNDTNHMDAVKSAQLSSLRWLHLRTSLSPIPTIVCPLHLTTTISSLVSWNATA